MNRPCSLFFLSRPKKYSAVTHFGRGAHPGGTCRRAGRAPGNTPARSGFPISPKNSGSGSQYDGFPQSTDSSNPQFFLSTATVGNSFAIFFPSAILFVPALALNSAASEFNSGGLPRGPLRAQPAKKQLIKTKIKPWLFICPLWHKPLFCR